MTTINRTLIDQALRSLSATATVKARFRIPRPAEEVEAVMRQAYANIVAARGRVMDGNDEATNRNIKSVARWLTTSTCRPCLLLQGNVGNGKTTMMQCVATTFEALREGATKTLTAEGWKLSAEERKPFEKLQTLPTIQLLTANQIVTAASKNSDDYTRIQRQMFIAIDDLGIEPATTKIFGTELTPVADIIYHRYDHLLPTIISTNLNDEEISLRYGVRIGDRLRELCDKLVYSSASYREK